MKQGYRSLLKHRKYTQHLSANLINRLGDSVDMITFSWLVFGLTGSAGWSAIILGVNMLPNLFIQPIAGAIVERLPKKNVIVFCDIGRGLLTTAILILYLQGKLQPVMLLVTTFLNNTFESFRNPASVSFVPMILPKEDYDFGLSLNQSSSRICELIGTGLGGVIIATIGLQGAIAIDVLSFFICAIFIATIPVTESYTATKQSMKVKLQACIQSMKEGFHYLINTKAVITICLIGCVLNMALVPLNSLETPYVSGTLHAPAYVLSIMSMALSIGIGIGAFLYPYLHKKISNKVLIIANGIATGVFYVLLAIYPSIPSLTIITICLTLTNLIYGCMVGTIMSLSSISFMKHVEKDFLARASAINGSIAIMGMPILSFILSAICEVASVTQILAYFGLFTIILFVGMIFMKRLDSI